MNWPTSIVIFLHLVPSSWGKQNSFIQLIQYNGSITGLSSCWCWSLYVTKSCKRFTCTVEWELHNQRSTILQSLLLGQIAFQRICVAFYLCTFYYFDHLNQTKSKQKKNQIPNFLWIIMSHKTVGNITTLNCHICFFTLIVFIIIDFELKPYCKKKYTFYFPLFQNHWST